jgi:hypothetical protein
MDAGLGVDNQDIGLRRGPERAVLALRPMISGYSSGRRASQSLDDC